MTTRNVCIALVLVSAAACGGGGGGYSSTPTGPSTPGTGNPSTSAAITVTSSAFSPGATTVPLNTTVQWTWNTCSGGVYGQTCTAHNVTFDDGVMSPTQSQDADTYSRTFNAPGTYTYHCTLHPMTGSVTVQ